MIEIKIQKETLMAIAVVLTLLLIIGCCFYVYDRNKETRNQLYQQGFYDGAIQDNFYFRQAILNELIKNGYVDIDVRMNNQTIGLTLVVKNVTSI